MNDLADIIADKVFILIEAKQVELDKEFQEEMNLFVSNDTRINIVSEEHKLNTKLKALKELIIKYTNDEEYEKCFETAQQITDLENLISKLKK